jgi:tetratricopeptide (TPR) repeat protein
MNMIANLEKMLAAGQDNALLRYSLGTACQKEGRIDEAVEHLAQAVQQDPGYSAAWKAYGKVLADAERRDEAASAFRTGIAVAEEKGDIQAAKEMKVFLRRLAKINE